MQTLWKTVWQLLIKLNIELSDDAEILLIGIYPGKQVFTQKFIHKYMFFQKTQNFGSDCTESVDHFGENGHVNYIESSKL